jgi:DNA-binding transcriptional ArsR family regulator
MNAEESNDAVFKALGDSRRRRILDLLRAGPKTTGQICDQFSQLDRCTVMQHLGVLERAGLTISRRIGRHRWNYFNPLPIKAIHDRWISKYAVGAVDLMARLKKDLEHSTVLQVASRTRSR